MTEKHRGDSALHVTDLHKEYPAPAGALRVLRGVSLEMTAGETLAVLGPSGSGKSTLLNILGTLDVPTGGCVRLGDVDPFALDAAALARFRSRRIGFVFQDHHLLPQCTAEENLLLAAMADRAVGDDDRRRAGELLERIGLAERAGHVPAELSGGERQRVAIARSLMNRPALLLCDEPTGNLDAHTAEAVTQLLLSLAEQHDAMLIVATHSAALVGRLGRRLRLRDGRLVDDHD